MIKALVPMKHDSERLKGKNFKKFAGKPLLHWILTSLSKSRYIDEIIIVNLFKSKPFSAHSNKGYMLPDISVNEWPIWSKFK